MRPLTYNLVGQRFGRLLVLERTQGKWLCRCECGTEKLVQGRALRIGATTSCGCFLKEIAGRQSLKHGMSNTSTHRCWKNMKTRCSNPKCRSYPHYGGRGIKVCERWQKFENFLADMGECPPGRSIERIEPNGDYEPRNCRWATSKEQNRNTSRSRLIEMNGQQKTLAEWCEIYGVPSQRIGKRLKRGMSPEQAFDISTNEAHTGSTIYRAEERRQ